MPEPAEFPDLKALHIITGLGVGGAEQQLRLLLRHLPLTCDVVTLTNPGPVAEGLTADGVHVTHLGMTGPRDLSALPRLTHLIRSGGYDLVHTHLYRACVYGRIAARLAGVRAVVATEHSLGDTQMEGHPLTTGVRALYLTSERLGRTTIAVSPTVATRLRRWGVPEPRIKVVPNGIDAPRFRYDPTTRAHTRRRLGLPENAYVIGAIGRLTATKRFSTLINALAQLPSIYWLLLVGDGPEANILRRTAQQAGVTDRVLFTGERPYIPNGTPGPTLPSLTSAMDVLASPSPEEAFGLALVEGLAAGLPVLYASCPAIEDLPPHLTTGTHRVRSDAHSFAQALTKTHTLTAPDRRSHPPTRPPSPAAHHYCITRTTAQLMDVYAAAASHSSPSPLEVTP